MRRTAGLLGAAWVAGLVGCSDGVVLPLADSLPCSAGSDALVLRRGAPLHVTYKSTTDAVACIDVVAGELIDLAVETTAGQLGVPTLTSDAAGDRPALTLTPLEARVQFPTRLVYPAVEAPATGRYLLYVVPTTCSRCVSFDGTAKLHFRSSGPVVAYKYLPTHHANLTQGASVVDTILFRNAGAGFVNLAFTSRDGIAVPESNSPVRVSGPSTGWGPGQGSVAYTFRVGGTNQIGVHIDVMTLTGLPDDVWNVVDFRTVAVIIRVHESAPAGSQPSAMAVKPRAP